MEWTNKSKELLKLLINNINEPNFINLIRI